MNMKESGKIILLFNAAWPMADFPPESQQLWSDQMQRLDFIDAKQAARQLIETGDRWPTLHQFLEATLAITRRRQVEEGKPEGRELHPRVRQLIDEEENWDPRTPEQMSWGKDEWVAHIREQLENARPYRIDPKTGERVELPTRVPGVRSILEVIAENLPTKERGK